MAEMVKAYEKQLIEFYLKENNYNVSQTAKHLDTDRSNLFKKIKQLNIQLSARPITLWYILPHHPLCFFS